MQHEQHLNNNANTFQSTGLDPIGYAQIKMKTILDASDLVTLQNEGKDRPLFRKCLLDNLNDLKRLIVALASRKGSL